MMDAQDRALIEAARPLMGKLKVYVHTRARFMDRQTFHEINQIVEDEAVLIQQRTGLKLPKLVAVFLPCVGHLQLVRADMERAGIEQLIKNMAAEFRSVDPNILTREIVMAIRAAFPAYKPARLITVKPNA
jgi:hypothetical protein